MATGSDNDFAKAIEETNLEKFKMQAEESF